MQIRICDVCFGHGGKVTKSVSKVSQSFYHNSVKVIADVCEEHRDSLKSMIPNELPKLLESFENFEKKSRQKGDPNESK